MAFDEVSAILPIDCFAISISLSYYTGKSFSKAHLLPNISSLAAEEQFAQVFSGWNEKGLFFQVKVEKPFEEAHFPRYFLGDAFELLVDTRDLKTASFLTQFCHHYLFLPQAVDGLQAQEMTHFRTEDRHELCQASELEIATDTGRKSYTMNIHIPSHCLHGYDPSICKRLGMAYVLHRFRGKPQHFSLSSQYIAVQQHPNLWASATLETR